MTTPPDDTRLPIKLDAASNGEYAPVPLDRVEREARQVALQEADRAARRLGLGRRAYLVSACGAAATLAAFDRVFAAAGRATGGRFSVPPDAAFDSDLAQATVGGDEFVFDVQLHHVNPEGPWRKPGALWEGALRGMPYSSCGESDLVRCFTRERLLKDVFLDSDTSVAVLSHVPGLDGDNPLSHEDALATKKVLDALDGTERLLLHGRVHPNVPGEIERMQAQAGSAKLAGFKTYTQFPGPGGAAGFFLDDERSGLPMIERARALGVRNICVHKGIPLSGRGLEFAGCRDIGVVAKKYPDMNFIVYHSGYFPGRGEGPADTVPGSGVDALVASLRANGIAPDSNVYAELGSTWRMLMRMPTMAAHLVGKLLLGVGERNVLWGTDSLWYGSPQDQIQAFRAFQIAPELRERHGYPELTPAVKRGIFGLNGARVYGLKLDALAPRLKKDRVQKARTDYGPQADPAFETYGPRNRREFLALKLHEEALSSRA